VSLIDVFGRLNARPAKHLPSHRCLLGRLERYPRVAEPPRLDLIAIPTSRPFADEWDALRIACDLAGEYGSRVLVICSGAARRADFKPEWMAGRRVQVAVVDLPDDPALPTLATSTHWLGNNDWTVVRDVAQKRNLALLLAAAAGWPYLLFLDDDVREVDVRAFAGQRLREFGVESVGEALAAMAHPDGPEAVGWIMTQFWDNSVVCHARRLGGIAQDSFIGGGALAVKVTPDTPFFPVIYNEDWLFFYGLLRHLPHDGRPRLALAGMVGQRPYDPYTHTRAASEELGDTLAEGLFAALQAVGRPDRLVFSPDFWTGVLSQRHAMVKRVRRRVLWRSVVTRARRLCASGGVRRPRQLVRAAWSGLHRRRSAHHALTSALRVHEQLGAPSYDVQAEIVDYLQAWGRDMRRWRKALRRHLAGAVPSRLLVGDAVTLVGASTVQEFLAGRPVREVPPVPELPAVPESTRPEPVRPEAVALPAALESDLVVA
jgi:hypothetical protein